MLKIHDPVLPRQTYASFDPDTRTPSKPVPPLSCDAQIHVFGALDRYPVRNDAVFEAPDATIEAARRMHRVLGIERCVIVQSTVYGYAHDAMIDALRLGGSQYRGVAMVHDGMSDRELRDLHDAGVRGARFNFFPGVNMISKPSSFRRCVERVAQMGWFIKVHPPTGQLGVLMELLEPLKVQVLLDHYGRPAMGGGREEDPTVRLVTELLQRGNWWVMLSNAHRFSQMRPGMADMAEVARQFHRAAPDRTVWGSDWPHPLSTERVLNDGEVIDFLLATFPDAQDIEAILVSNPGRLFQFEV